MKNGFLVKYINLLPFEYKYYVREPLTSPTCSLSYDEANNNIAQQSLFRKRFYTTVLVIFIAGNSVSSPLGRQVVRAASDSVSTQWRYTEGAYTVLQFVLALDRGEIEGSLH